ncbi:MAG: biopolymer transporter ExbB [Acidithiobacillales bacterium SM23_46]|jgi:biopolymer transport protein ExbB|nr:MAG: biopolymer transporter ExbB [Acidithiobacillales bacterium SM23_46]KPL27660.1 MAG: biopolymer transporter ExbB [Acidithiobacillales bacterium SM1_46]
MFELIRAGGWVMWPLILCSIAALAIIGERFWSLQKKYVAPESLLPQVRQWLARDELDGARLELLRESSLLGRILSAGLVNREHDRDIIKEAIEDAGRHSVPELERYLRTLGTIAAISPFLGLLGTVLGMIEMFMGIGSKGVGDPSIVASGIAQALIATASGLTVAIPSLIFYRYFRGRVNDLLVDMEQTALKLVEILQGERESD